MCLFFRRKQLSKDTLMEIYSLSPIHYNTLINTGINNDMIETVSNIEKLTGDQLYACLITLRHKECKNKYIYKKKLRDPIFFPKTFF